MGHKGPFSEVRSASPACLVSALCARSQFLRGGVAVVTGGGAEAKDDHLERCC